MSEFFLIVLAIILISGVFRRYIFFFLMRALSKKIFRDFNKMQGGGRGPFQQNHYQRRPEGTVIIEDKNTPKKPQNNPVTEAGGEYVDFEEIKD